MEFLYLGYREQCIPACFRCGIQDRRRLFYGDFGDLRRSSLPPSQQIVDGSREQQLAGAESSRHPRLLSRHSINRHSDNKGGRNSAPHCTPLLSIMPSAAEWRLFLPNENGGGGSGRPPPYPQARALIAIVDHVSPVTRTDVYLKADADVGVKRRVSRGSSSSSRYGMYYQNLCHPSADLSRYRPLVYSLI